MPDEACERIRVIVVAPYAATRAGFRALLAGRCDINVIAEASGSADLEMLLHRLHPHVAACDPDAQDSPRLLDLLVRAEIPAVWLSESREMLLRLAESSLSGWAFLSRNADGEEIAAAIRASMGGLAALDRAMANDLMARSLTGQFAVDTSANDDILTGREREVLQLMANGLPNKVIAARLGITLHTVKFHVASILAKLDAESRTEAVTIGARRGLVAL